MDELPELGPDSLTWRRFGDRRMMLLMAWAGTLQAMHPVISAGLVQHSDFFDNPANRLLRSAYPIVDVVYRGVPAGRRVRDFHRGIAGRDAEGNPYHALQPEPYFWAHATFVGMQYVAAEYFGDRLDAEQKERLYAESLSWYANYGLSMRGVPRSYAEYRRYFERVSRDVLVHSAAIRNSPAHNGSAGPPPFPWVPRVVWAVFGPVGTALQMWIAGGLLPEPVRATLGWRWSRRDEVLLRCFGTSVRAVFSLIPPRYRLNAQARRAYREAGRAVAVPRAMH